MTTRRILVAGVGNAWLTDDGFGSAVVAALDDRELPVEVAVFDFATDGLDLVRELRRGYSALVLITVRRWGGEPGTLYVREPDEADAPAALRLVRALGTWPERVVLIACEPAVVEAMGMQLSPAVREAVATATDLVVETIEELRAEATPAERAVPPV